MSVIKLLVMMVGDKNKLPATSTTLPILGKFYIGLICIIFCATCSTRVILNVQMRGNCEQPIPHWLTVVFLKYRILRHLFSFPVKELVSDNFWGNSLSFFCKIARISPPRVQACAAGLFFAARPGPLERRPGRPAALKP